MRQVHHYDVNKTNEAQIIRVIGYAHFTLNKCGSLRINRVYNNLSPLVYGIGVEIQVIILIQTCVHSAITYN